MPFVFDNPNHHGSGFYFDDPSETSSGSGGGGGFSGDLGVNMTAQSLLVKQNWIKAGNAYVGDRPEGATSGGDAALGWSALNGLADGNTITITTDGTYSFGTKSNAKPHFYWTADGGQAANTTLGTADWDSSSFTASTSTAQVATNSSQSYVFDHGASTGAALGSITYSDRDLFVFRRIYTEHNPFSNYAARIRYVSLTGTLNVGDTLTGAVSGATATILSFDGSTIYCDRSVSSDSINQVPTPTDFNIGEVINTNNGASFTANEGSNVPFRTYNYKMLRAWGEQGGSSINNFYFSPVINGSSYFDPNADTYLTVTKEYTDSTYSPNTIILSSDQWESHEVSVRSSSAINTADGEIRVRIGGVEMYETGVVTRDTEDPLEYQELFQTQASNGMQPNSNTYYDCLYVDEGLNRAMIGNASTWAACTDAEPIIWTSYADTSISGQIRQGAFTSLTGKYLYVFDADGLPVSTTGVAL